MTTTATMRRAGRALAVAALTLAFAAGAALTAPTEAEAAPLPDASPTQVSAVAAATGQTTVFVRGTDNAIWYRTGRYSNYGSWKAIPYPAAGLTSGPAATISELSGPQLVTVVARNGYGAAMFTQSWLDGTTGEPTTWGAWSSMGGNFTSALSAASLGDNRWAVAGRGTDGAVWLSIAGGQTGRPTERWQSLGGAAYSAPTVEAEWTGSAWRWRTFVVGTDWRVWQRSSNVDGLGAIGPWIGGWVYSSHGLGSINTFGNPSRTDRLISTGGADHSVVVADPDSTRYAALGGWITSTAALVRQDDGSVLVLARGGDNALWYQYYYPGSPPASSGWYLLGGQLL